MLYRNPHREPCIYKIETENGIIYMLSHTDDVDLIIQSENDTKRVLEECDTCKLFGVKGNKGGNSDIMIL